MILEYALKIIIDWGCFVEWVGLKKWVKIVEDMSSYLSDEH